MPIVVPSEGYNTMSLAKCNECGNQVSTKADKCPNCGKSEDIIETCNHCGYVYKDDDYLDAKTKWLIAIIIIVGIWLIITIISWFLDVGWDNRSLLEIIKDQWTWIKQLKIV